MPTVVHVCSDVYSSEVPAGTNQTHTPPLIRISPLYKMILLNVKVVMGSSNKNIM